MKATHHEVRQLLGSIGKMTSAEVATFFTDSTPQDVSAILSTMHRGLAKQQVYIAGWTREQDGAKDYLRALYALGRKPDAPKPPVVTNPQRCAKYRAKFKLPVGVPNSVWQLAEVLS